MRDDYVHGYSSTEALRLSDQAGALEHLIHDGVVFPAGSTVLEAGCGVGAQTVSLLRRSPAAHFTCVDIDLESLTAAAARVTASGLPLPTFQQANLCALPFPDARFDQVFSCFVLEHLREPERALAEFRRVLRPGGRLVAIEGDHGSALFHPDDTDARGAIECQIALQARAGGNACIGRRLGPLLRAAGLDRVETVLLPVYADSSRPALVNAFIRRTFTAMVEAVREAALEASLATGAGFDRGIAALRRTAEPGGAFTYLFYRSTACTPAITHGQ